MMDLAGQPDMAHNLPWLRRVPGVPLLSAGLTLAGVFLVHGLIFLELLAVGMIVTSVVLMRRELPEDEEIYA